MMAKLKKANRIIEVHDSQVDSYLRRGYDLIDDTGNIIKVATGGKTVSISEYNKLLNELNKLKANSGNVDVSKYEQKIKQLETENKELREENEAFEKEINRLEEKLKEFKRK